MNSNLFFTNVLLAIIAGLLLVQVVQNGTGKNASSRPQLSTESYPSTQSTDSVDAPSPSTPAMPKNMGHNMFFMAIKAFPEGCAGKKILDECNSPAAQVVKSKIEEQINQGKGPRQIFDFVVATYGEKVLTDQALQIRQMRVRPK